MGILDQLLGRGSSQPDYEDKTLLREIWKQYCAEWPENHESFSHWKPDTLLPAPRWALKRAIKLCYSEWEQELDWTIFSSFSMEFMNLGMHIPAADYALIERFRKGRVSIVRQEPKDGDDPLLLYLPSVIGILEPFQQHVDAIRKIRDNLKRSDIWNPIDADDHEIAEVRRILLTSAVDRASLLQEWRYYAVSIGRDVYVMEDGRRGCIA